MIRNKVNGKLYIGRTSNYETRKKSHYTIALGLGNNNKKRRPLYVDIIKFGWDNFVFSILEEDLTFEDASEKEEFYIKKYKTTYLEYGYNKKRGEILGGKGYYKYDDAIIDRVFELLINTDVSLEAISDETGLSLPYLRDINSGSRIRREGISYPIRNIDKRVGEDVLLKIIDMLKNTNMPQKEIAKELGVARSTVTMTNIGKNNYRDDLEYPIRKKKSN